MTYYLSWIVFYDWSSMTLEGYMFFKPTVLERLIIGDLIYSLRVLGSNLFFLASFDLKLGVCWIAAPLSTFNIEGSNSF